MSTPVNLGNATCLKKSSSARPAIMVELDDEPGEVLWVPCSQVHDDSEVYDVGHEGDLIVTEWWARQKGYT